MRVPVADLVEQFGPDAVRVAAVRAWARAHRLAAGDLGRAAGVVEMLDRALPADVTAAGEHLDVGAGPEGLEAVFETVLGRDRRRSHGAVYTPAFIVDHLCREGLAMSAADAPVVCDPFCGSGSFLVGAADALSRRLGIAPGVALAEHLVGIDTDPEALMQARVMCELYLLVRGSPGRLTVPRLLEADTLLAPAGELTAACGVPDGFDLVATNPPYVKLQNLERAHRAALAERYPDCAAGSFSLSLLFLAAGRELLSSDGCLAVITQNNVFTSLAGRGVRARLQRDGAIRRVVDFGHGRVFPGASAYTCLLFLGRGPTERFQYAAVSGEVTADALARCRYAEIRHSDLDASKWRLAEPRHLANLRRLESGGPRLGDATAIRVGFATLKDAVFLVTRRGDSVVATHPASQTTTEIEPEATVPALKVPTLSSTADVEDNRLRVIFPYAREDGRRRPLDEAALRARFPATYAHLSRCRDLLGARDKGRGAYRWYEWGRTQGMEARGPKLLTRTFSRGPTFVLDPTDSLYCNGYGLFARSGYPLAAVARVVNSRVFHYYARLTSFRIEGGYECYQKNFIERFCLPDLPARELDELVGLDEPALEERLRDHYRLRVADLDSVLAAPGLSAQTRSVNTRR